MRASQLAQARERVVLEYQLQNTVESLANVRPDALKEGQSIWSKRRQGFQPCFEAGIRELLFLFQVSCMYIRATPFFIPLNCHCCTTGRGGRGDVEERVKTCAAKGVMYI